jgi:hypothetical protein
MEYCRSFSLFGTDIKLGVLVTEWGTGLFAGRVNTSMRSARYFCAKDDPKSREQGTAPPDIDQTRETRSVRQSSDCAPKLENRSGLAPGEQLFASGLLSFLAERSTRQRWRLPGTGRRL